MSEYKERGGGGRGFFFNDTATTEIYTLSLHDALPISGTIQQQIESIEEDMRIIKPQVQTYKLRSLLDEKIGRAHV